MKLTREIDIEIIEANFTFHHHHLNVCVDEKRIKNGEFVTMCERQTLRLDDESRKILTDLRSWIEKNLK